MKKSKKIGCIVNGLEIVDCENINGRTCYKVKCIYCNSIKTIFLSTKSKCKCQYKSKVTNYIDGRSKERLYHVYQSARQRVINPKNGLYRMYGGRGIKMCDEWLSDYQAFKKWAYENGYDDKAPRGICTLDRIDVDGNYEPNNCRWITIQEQEINQTTTRLITYDGKTQCAKDWAKELKISYNTFLLKINSGYTIEQIIKWNKERRERENKVFKKEKD